MKLTLSAQAKVNLTLEALAKRDDGYHEIATVLQTISLADTLSFETGESVELTCNVASLRSADNLVLKAATLLKEATGCRRGALIHLTKVIPLAAGLGSGATDAAAALVGLNKLWELDLPFEGLADLAAKLGSDVVFFLYGGTALARGRGERVTPLPPAPEQWMVLLRPAIEPAPNKTARLYSRLNTHHFTSGQFTDRLVEALHQGRGMGPAALYNVFEQIAFEFFPGLSDYRSRLLQAGADRVHLAGAGPVLFTLVPAKGRGETIMSSLEADGLEAYLVRTVQRSS